MEKRAQRIPSWPGVIHSNKGRIHLRRPTCGVLKFRLRRGGGPYISLAARRRTIHFACGEAADHTFRLSDFHDRSLSRGQRLSRRASEERGCKFFLVLRRVCGLLSRGSFLIEEPDFHLLSQTSEWS